MYTGQQAIKIKKMVPTLELGTPQYVKFRYILSRATFPGAPSYGGVWTWVEVSQTRGDHMLAEASNLLGYKEYAQQDFNTCRVPPSQGLQVTVA